jgi:hypothetical protein
LPIKKPQDPVEAQQQKCGVAFTDGFKALLWNVETG